MCSYLGHFLQLLSLRSLNDSPEKLLLLLLVPERKERGEKEREDAMNAEHLLCVLLCMQTAGLLFSHMLVQLVFKATLKSGVRVSPFL